MALNGPLQVGVHRLRVRLRDIMAGPEPAVLAEETVDLTKEVRRAELPRSPSLPSLFSSLPSLDSSPCLSQQDIEPNGAKHHLWVPLRSIVHVDSRAGILLELRWVVPRETAHARARSVHVSSRVQERDKQAERSRGATPGGSPVRVHKGQGQGQEHHRRSSSLVMSGRQVVGSAPRSAKGTAEIAPTCRVPSVGPSSAAAATRPATFCSRVSAAVQARRADAAAPRRMTPLILDMRQLVGGRTLGRAQPCQCLLVAGRIERRCPARRTWRRRWRCAEGGPWGWARRLQSRTRWRR